MLWMKAGSLTTFCCSPRIMTMVPSAGLPTQTTIGSVLVIAACFVFCVPVVLAAGAKCAPAAAAAATTPAAPTPMVACLINPRRVIFAMIWLLSENLVPSFTLRVGPSHLPAGSLIAKASQQLESLNAQQDERR